MKRFPKKCGVCHEWCSSRLEWFNHFFQKVHLDKVNEERKVVDSEKMRSCSVLISGQFPLEGMQVLEYFSKAGKHIRNFVWNPDRPRVGVIQFESSESVDRLMKETKESHVWVSGDRIEVKRNYDLGVLKVKARPSLPSTSRIYSSAKAMARGGASSDSDSSVEAVKAKKTPAQSKPKMGSIIPNKLSEHLLSFSKVDGLTVSFLSSQFAAIQAEVEIPETEFLIILNLLERIQKIVTAKNPIVKFTTLFRHNYLKLRNAGSNHLLIYLSQFQHRPLSMSFFEVEKLFEGSQLQPLGHDHAALATVECGYPYLDTQTGLHFGIVFHPDHEAEVVTCQLARHLISFDHKARSFLTLVHFWARENDVTLSEKEILRKYQGYNIPDPAALEWLCIFYLTQEGIIPSLKEMRKEARERNFWLTEGNKDSIISFPRDLQFRKEWQQAKIKYYLAKISNEYVLDVLQLVLGFFNFCSKTDFKGKVLKTMEGKIVELLPAIEDGLISESINPDKYGDAEELRRKAKKLEEELIGEMYLMQPFIPTRRFQVDQKKFENHVVPLMKKAARKLEFYVNSGQRNTMDGKVLEVELKSLFQYGKLEVLYGILKNENRENNTDVTPQIQWEEQQKGKSQDNVVAQQQQKNVFIEQLQKKLFEEQLQRKLLEVQQQRKLIEEGQRKKLFEEQQQKKLLEEQQQKKLLEQQKHKMLFEEQLLEEEQRKQQKKLLEKKLFEEQLLEEQQRKQQKKLLEKKLFEEQLLEEQQRKQQKQKKLFEEQLLEEQQRKQQKKLLEQEHQKKLLEQQRQKKLFEEQLFEEQQRKQQQLEIQKQLKHLKVEQQSTALNKEPSVVQTKAKLQLPESPPVTKAKEATLALNKSESMSLVNFFNALSEEVTMPTDKWDALVEFRQTLSDFFSSNGFPGCNLVLFRNRYLKLYYEGVEANIFLFLDHPGLYSVENGTRQALIPKLPDIRRLIEQIHNNDQYSEQMKQLLLAAIETVPSPKIGARLEYPIFSFEETDFHIATRCFLPELQACRLIEYLSTTDPRVKPVMKVIYYWAKVNKIRLGKVSTDEEENSPSKLIVGVAPDPALLEWLVIFFLSERQIVPELSEICGSKVDEGLFFDGVDVGFKGDPETALELWDRYEDGEGEKHILNVLELAHGFFQYWSDFGAKAKKKPVVLNLRNGNSFFKEEVTKNSHDMRSLSWATGISLPDLKNLHLEPMISESFYDSQEPVTILHPLYIQYCFSFCAKTFVNSVCLKMKAVQGQLREMLRDCKGDGGRGFSWNIEKVFKVES